jgi:hypothetical protein
MKTVKFPEHIIKQYGSSRKFRESKRAALRKMEIALRRLYLGCAYLPSGSQKVQRIERELKALRDELSVKAWGR